jgi:hypothetical protein
MTDSTPEALTGSATPEPDPDALSEEETAEPEPAPDVIDTVKDAFAQVADRTDTEARTESTEEQDTHTL